MANQTSDICVDITLAKFFTQHVAFKQFHNLCLRHHTSNSAIKINVIEKHCVKKY